jgi:hypothetical protein
MYSRNNLEEPLCVTVCLLFPFQVKLLRRTQAAGS